MIADQRFQPGVDSHRTVAINRTVVDLVECRVATGGGECGVRDARGCRLLSLRRSGGGWNQRASHGNDEDGQLHWTKRLLRARRQNDVWCDRLAIRVVASSAESSIENLIWEIPLNSHMQGGAIAREGAGQECTTGGADTGRPSGCFFRLSLRCAFPDRGWRLRDPSRAVKQGGLENL